MSLYADFIKEREGFDIIEDEGGFVTYRILGNECYARDIYLRPEHRGDKMSFLLGRMVMNKAKEAGCRYFVSSVWCEDPNKERSIAMLKRFGMKELKQEDNLVYFVKEIE